MIRHYDYLSRLVGEISGEEAARLIEDVSTHQQKVGIFNQLKGLLAEREDKVS